MRLYEVEEARALLPRLRPVLERLRDAFAALRGARALEAAQRRAALTDGHPIEAPPAATDDEERAAHEATLRECLRELEAWGVELKDPARGLVDFHHERDGEVVYLCYELAETDIAFWHTIEAGYAGRRPL